MLSAMAMNNVSVQPSLMESSLLFHFSTEIFRRSDSKKHDLDFFFYPREAEVSVAKPCSSSLDLYIHFYQLYSQRLNLL